MNTKDKLRDRLFILLLTLAALALAYIVLLKARILLVP